MISATMVKDLRDKTGAGMMDCKRALAEANGDMEKAIDNLRKSGIAKAEKKASRATKEGRIISSIKGSTGALVEVLCETDFVATNDKFNAFITGVADKALSVAGDGDVCEAVNAQEKDVLVSMIATIGENMQIRRAVKWESKGKIASYLHMGGRIAVMVDVEGEVSDELLSDLCMHIAAFSPAYIVPEDVPAEAIAKEKEIAAAQMAGKPADMIDKIVMGKINKWYSEVCVTRQPWIKDDKSCFSKIAPKATIRRFVRWAVADEI